MKCFRELVISLKTEVEDHSTLAELLVTAEPVAQSCQAGIDDPVGF